MRLTPAFNWLLLCLIPMTITWKLVAEPAVHETQRKIASFLAKQRFKVTEQSLVEGLPMVRASVGNCSMLVAEASSDGSMRNIVRRDVTTTMDRHFLVFRGHVYDAHSTWLTVTRHWWIGFLHKLGIARADAPPIMVAAAQSCAAERLPWAEL